ncbi:PREDICTED: zinc finger protein CONSTANS-LIKE 4-like [Nelumbo nucifera]|uniref:Zinc finger protein CONSTANS-LIKE 4-like n=1 Tax=Nelumbo nucifera TaxID=4432 RepID=A0A1U7YXF1_NELNU|nr:PREDICTED: zinc finger protein CONSTANS-LIKE 4-like [Nelumbo nucifera]
MAIDNESGKGYPASWSLSAKPSDFYKSASNLLFCRADSTFLCFNYDAKVHGTNKLASRHERVWMCEVCEQAPVSVTCKTGVAALYVTCDRDIHSANPPTWQHERIPVVPFYESAASAMKSNVANLLVPDGLLKSSDDDDDRNDKEEDNDTYRKEAEAASWLLPNPNLAKLMETPDLKSGDYFFSDVDPYLDLDYGSSMETRYHHQNSTNADSVVPVHTKPPPPPLMNTSNHCFDMGFCRSKLSYGYTTPTIS